MVNFSELSFQLKDEKKEKRLKMFCLLIHGNLALYTLKTETREKEGEVW